MDIRVVIVCKLVVWSVVAVPCIWQTMDPQSSLRRGISRSRHPFLSGRSSTRWEFPSRAECALSTIPCVATFALAFWIYFLPPVAVPMSVEEQSVMAATFVLAGILLCAGIWLGALYHVRVEFSHDGITTPSPRRFLRGTFLWNENSEVDVDFRKQTITFVAPSETLTWSLEGMDVLHDAVAHFRGPEHPIAVSLRGITTKHG